MKAEAGMKLRFEPGLPRPQHSSGSGDVVAEWQLWLEL
jgi:hypothetical protein